MDFNTQSNLALKYIQQTGCHLFLTGKAGTGKTTFLRQLKEISPKRMIVVAPTGVAAINAGGVTIHSFFQLPFGPYLPTETTGQQQKSPVSYNQFRREKLNIIRSIDLLVIDEISMVRADLLDAVSDTMQRIRHSNKPFGGVQLLLIGDMQQLAPVAKEEEWNLLKPFYASPYFFDSNALKASSYISIELTHVYRQQDDRFISLLNNIRENRFDDLTLQALNARYIPDFDPKEEERYITLTTHNYPANQINNRKLQALPGSAYSFKAKVTGEFPPYLYPTDEQLTLKEGAQVMFIKNDSSQSKRYFNGKIGRVTEINSERIVVTDEEGTEIEVNEERWDNTRYAINATSKEIEEEIVGNFTHIPLRTAWAITIHKSQGLTFERAIIDASAAFSHGQVYVALSRCKSLEGMVLSSPISRNARISDERINEYNHYVASIHGNEQSLQEAQRSYYITLLTELFDFSLLHQHLNQLATQAYNHLNNLYPGIVRRYHEAREQMQQEIKEVGSRFCLQLYRMASASASPADEPTIQERIRKGNSYFAEKIAEILVPLPDPEKLDIDNKETNKLIRSIGERYNNELKRKKAVISACKEGFSVTAYLSAKSKSELNDEVMNRKQRKGKAGKSSKAKEENKGVVYSPEEIQHPALYNKLRHWRMQKAEAEGMPAYTVLQQKALVGIAASLPRNDKELLKIHGIGKTVIERHGEEIRHIIELYCEEKGIM